MAINKYDFSDAVELELDTNMIESEGEDLRIDFPGDYSIWVRSGTSVEGTMPKRHKKVIQVLSPLPHGCIIVFLLPFVPSLRGVHIDSGRRGNLYSSFWPAQNQSLRNLAIT